MAVFPAVTFASLMERFELAATDRTPAVLLDPVSGTMELSGVAIPENADRFFSPLHALVDSYAAQPPARTTVRIQLSYFNSSSAKYLLDLFRQWEDVHAAGSTKVSVEWCYAAGDLDMREAGMDYKALLEVPVKLVEQA
jgi:hypothetical protein